MMSCRCNWKIPPADLILSNDDVHLWRAKLDQSDKCVKQLTQILSDDELRRAERFRFDKDRKYFIVTRGILRIILSHYLSVKSDQLQFGYSTYGKPYLAVKSNGNKIYFNLSRSHNLALCAFTRSHQIGVDIEYIRPITKADQIVARFFSAHEHAMWQQIPKDQKQEAFFHIWASKEAYIKARGEGLSMHLDQFDVSFAPGRPTALLIASRTSGESSRWLLRTLQPGPDYVAALVVEGYDWQLKCWDWTF
jgi:4'-phosphopantetheinyl transferase